MNNNPRLNNLFLLAMKGIFVSGLVCASSNAVSDQYNHLIVGTHLSQDDYVGEFGRDLINGRSGLEKACRKMSKDISEGCVYIDNVLLRINELYSDKALNAFDKLAITSLINQVASKRIKISDFQHSFIEEYKKPSNKEYKDILLRTIKDLSLLKSRTENLENTLSSMILIPKTYQSNINLEKVSDIAKITSEKMKA